jgi:hypothetical protein
MTDGDAAFAWGILIGLYVAWMVGMFAIECPL